MDSSTSKPFQQEKNALLARNKMPSELLAKVQPENDFTTQFKDMQKMNYNYSQMASASYYSAYQYSTPYYESYGAQQESYQTDFPRAENYNSYFSIIETFPHLEGINDPNFDAESISPEAQFYIIRSGCDDNIHKAIKYHIWTSTINGKATLRNAWKNFLDRNLEPEIYLIFTVVNSNQFLGVAKMTSDINNDETFMYWWEPCKWFGTFQVQWLFIKDIHHQNFVHLREGPENTLVINFKDSSPLSAKTGKIILEIFKRHPTRPNVFDSFEFMDMREDQVRAHRDDDEEFQGYFAEWCDACKNDVRNTNPDWKPEAKKQKQNKGYFEKKGRRAYKKRGYQGNRNSKFDDEEEQYTEEMEYKMVKGKHEGGNDRKNRAGLSDLKDFPKLSEANEYQPKNKRSQDENSQLTSNIIPN